MEKTSRQLLLHWIDEHIYPEDIPEKPDAHQIQEDLKTFCKQLITEVRETTAMNDNRNEVDFYLCKNYQLLFYCTKRIHSYISSSKNIQHLNLYHNLMKTIITATIQFISENRALFHLEEQPVYGGVAQRLLRSVTDKMAVIGYNLKKQGNTAIASKLYEHVLLLLSSHTLQLYTLSHTIRFINHVYYHVQQGKTIDDKQFICMLVQYNCNAPALMDYAMRYIRQCYCHPELPDAALQHIKNFLKEVQCIACLVKAGFSKDAETAKEQILSVLLNELDYLQASVQTEAGTDTCNAADPEKIPMELSVDELAALFRLLKENRLIKEPNTKKMCRQVISSFKSCKSDAIALSSFINKYYNVERRTIDSLKNIFIDLHKKAHSL